MKLGKIDDNDDYISRPPVVKSKRKRLIIPSISKDSPLLKPGSSRNKTLNIYESMKKMKIKILPTNKDSKPQDDFAATIITLDELNKFAGVQQQPLIVDHPENQDFSSQ